MKRDAKVKEYPDLVKKVGGYIVNTNSDEYRRAVARNRKTKREAGLESRVTQIENTLQKILALLEGQKDAT